MEQARGQAFRQLGVLALVLSGHALLVSFWSSGWPSDTRKSLTQAEPRTTLVLLNLESRAEPPPLEQTPKAAAPAPGIGRTRADRPRKSASVAPSNAGGEPSESTAINPGGARTTPRTDWQRELETAVEAVAPEMIREYTRLCAEAERTHAPRPPGCNRRSYDGPWRPSGNLLQDMRDPDRPRSSVPDPLPEAFPRAPRSEVFQNNH